MSDNEFGIKVDLAVDTSELDTAKEIIKKWSQTATLPLHLDDESIKKLMETIENVKKAFADGLQLGIREDEIVKLKSLRLGLEQAAAAIGELNQQRFLMQYSSLEEAAAAGVIGKSAKESLAIEKERATILEKIARLQANALDRGDKNTGETASNLLSRAETASTLKDLGQIRAEFAKMDEQAKIALANEKNALQEVAQEERDRLKLEEQRLALQERIRMEIARVSSDNPFADRLKAMDDNAGFVDNLNDLSQAKHEFKSLQIEMRQAQTDVEQFSASADKMGASIKAAFQFDEIVDFAMNAFKNLIARVTEIDTQMTELRKVTDLTAEGYAEFGRIAVDTAGKIGTSLADVVRSTADFARLGYSMDGSAQSAAEAALVLKNVGDGIGNISEATEMLISTQKAFGDEISQGSLMTIVDKMNEVGNNLPISVQGIGEALKRSASSLSMANNSIEESIALVVGANNTLQDAEKAGTALNSISITLRGAKEDAEAFGGAINGDVNSVSKLRDAIKTFTGGKVDIMLDDSTFKSTYEILRDISAVYKDLSDVDQAGLLETIAGKRNSNAAASILKSFDNIEKAKLKALDAEGSALKENERYLDSIEGRTAQFSLSIETLALKTIDTEGYKDLLSVLTQLSNLVGSFMDIAGPFPLLLGAIGTSFALNTKQLQGDTFGSYLDGFKKIGGSIQEATSKLNDFFSNLKLGFQHGEGVTQLQKFALAINDFKQKFNVADNLDLDKFAKANTTVEGLGDAYNQLKLQEYQLITSQAGLSASTKATATSMMAGKVTTNGFTAATVGLSMGAKAATVALNILKVAGPMLIITAISMAIAKIAEGIEWLTKSQERAREAAEASKKIADETAESAKKMANAQKEYAEAMRMVDDVDRKNKILDIERQITDALGERAGAISLANKSEEEAMALLKELNAEQLKAAETEAKINLQRAIKSEQKIDVRKGNVYDDSEYGKEIASAYNLKDDKVGASQRLEDLKKARDTIAQSAEQVLKEELFSYIEKEIARIDAAIGEADTVIAAQKKLDDVQNSIRMNEALEAVTFDTNNAIESFLNLKKAMEDSKVQSLTFWEALAFSAEDIEKLKNETGDFIAKNLPDEFAAAAMQAEAFLNTLALDKAKQAKAENPAASTGDIESAVMDDLLQNEKALSLFNEGLVDTNDFVKALAASMAAIDPEHISQANVYLGATASSAQTASDAMQSLRQTIEGVAQATEIANAATQDMQNTGTVSLDTLAKMKAVLGENEHISDYIDSSGNFLAEAWEARSKRMIEAERARADASLKAKISELDGEKALLQNQLAIEKERLAALLTLQADLQNGKIKSENMYRVEMQKIQNLETEDAAKVLKKREGIFQTFYQTLSKNAKSSIEFIQKTLAGKYVGEAPVLINSKNQNANANFSPAISNRFEQMAQAQLSEQIKKSKASISNIEKQLQANAKARKDLEAQLAVNEKNATASINSIGKQGGARKTSSSGKTVSQSKKEVDEYTASINKLQKAEEELARQQELTSDIENDIGRAENLEHEIDLRWQLIEQLKQEQAAAEELLRQRRELVAVNVDTLRQNGFEVAYDQSSDQLQIENMEHINQLKAKTTEKTNALRKEMESLIKDTQDWNKTNQDAADGIDDLTQKAKKGIDDIISGYDKMRDNAAKSLSSLRSAHDQLEDVSSSTKIANGDYAEAFFPSIETFEKLMAMEPKYLAYLSTEGGLLTTNSEAMREDTAAKVEELAVQNALTMVRTAAAYAAEGETEKLRELLDVKYSNITATWDLVDAEAAAVNMDDDLKQTMLDNVQKMKDLSSRAQYTVKIGLDEKEIKAFADKLKGVIKDLMKGLQDIFNSFVDSLKNALGDMMDKQIKGLQDVLSMTQELVKYEAEQRVDAIQKQIDGYNKIVDLKKQALDMDRANQDYDEQKSQLLEEVSALQMQANNLSLDARSQQTGTRTAADLAAVQKELAEKQKELYNLQADRAYESTMNALDASANAFADTKQQEIDAVNASVSSSEKVYRLALEQLSKDYWGTMDKILAMQWDSGGTLFSDVKAAFKEADKAIVLGMDVLQLDFKTVLDLLTTLSRWNEGGLATIISDAIAFTQGGILSAAGEALGVDTSITRRLDAFVGLFSDMAGSAVNMFANAAGGVFEQLANQITDLFAGLMKFHGGGIVDSNSTSEVLAFLQKGELVATTLDVQNLSALIASLRSLDLSALNNRSIALATPSLIAFETPPQRATQQPITIDKIELHVHAAENTTPQDAQNLAEIVAKEAINRIKQELYLYGSRK